MAIPKISDENITDNDDVEQVLNTVADNSYLIVDAFESDGFEEAVAAIDDMIEGLGHVRAYIEETKKRKQG